MAFPPMSRSCSRQSARFQSLQELERLGTGEESTVETRRGTPYSNISLPDSNRERRKCYVTVRDLSFIKLVARAMPYGCGSGRSWKCNVVTVELDRG